MEDFNNTKKSIKETIKSIELDLKNIFDKNKEYLNLDETVTKDYIDKIGGIDVFEEVLELQTILNVLENYSKKYDI